MGLQNMMRGGGGGVSEVSPLRKGRGVAEKDLSMLKTAGGGGEGSQNVFLVVLTREVEVLAMLKGGGQKMSTL